MEGQSWGHRPPQLLTWLIPPIALALIAHPLLPILFPTLDLSSLPPQPSFPALQANVGFSLLAFIGAIHIVPKVSGAFVDKGLRGRDLCKKGGRDSGPVV